MDRRAVAGLALAGALAAAGCSGSAGALQAGRADPLSAEGARAAGTQVVWVSRPADLLSCQTPARALRRIQLRDSGVEVRLVLVGNAGGLEQGFLRQHRLTAEVERITPAQYRRRLGNTALPAMYVVRGGSVTRAWTSRAKLIEATDGEDPPLMQTVMAVR